MMSKPETVITEDTVLSIIESETPVSLYENKRVLVLTPDATRTCPLPLLIEAINTVIGAKTAKLDFMVALGTHTPLTDENLRRLYGLNSDQALAGFSRSDFYNHRWDKPDTLIRLGALSPSEIEMFSDGLLSEEIPIEINRKALEYDLIIILGPVFPHEVVGFSGGAKYLFPGISGGDFLHFFHWLSAVITCRKIIGIKNTPVRAAINRAMDFIKAPVFCFAAVVDKQASLLGFFAGDPKEAWSRAADLSAQIHIVEKPGLFQKVFGVASVMYDELWTAGKVMYKLEQVVAPGGQLIIYGPHIKEISRTWGEFIERTGYHIRDYFLADMERFQDIPLGILAHSTHVRGGGVFENGMEKPLVDVVLATSIPEDMCRKVNLGYLDPDSIDLSDFMNREEEGMLFVDNAGEILYRLAESETL